MFSSDLEKRFDLVNQSYKEIDSIYHSVAVRFGISDSVMWVLYTICDIDGPCTQHDICSHVFLPKQTVNSAISALIKSGDIYLEPVPDMGKKKIIKLTEKGKTLADSTVRLLWEAEVRAFGRFSKDEQDIYLKQTRQHISYMREEFDKIFK